MARVRRCRHRPAVRKPDLADRGVRRAQPDRDQDVAPSSSSRSTYRSTVSSGRARSSCSSSAIRSFRRVAHRGGSAAGRLRVRARPGCARGRVPLRRVRGRGIHDMSAAGRWHRIRRRPRCRCPRAAGSSCRHTLPWPLLVAGGSVGVVHSRVSCQSAPAVRAAQRTGADAGGSGSEAVDREPAFRSAARILRGGQPSLNRSSQASHRMPAPVAVPRWSAGARATRPWPGRAWATAAGVRYQSSSASSRFRHWRMSDLLPTEDSRGLAHRQRSL
jgi:hypothetical protein